MSDRPTVSGVLFALRKSIGYKGWCLSESPATSDTVRVNRYDRTLFDELTKQSHSTPSV